MTVHTDYLTRKNRLIAAHEHLISRPNTPKERTWGWLTRYTYPVLTAAHIPLSWRYDFSEEHNPNLLERLPVNAVFNPGALYWNGKYLLVARVEGVDRKSFFAIAESPNGIDQFRFWNEPIALPETEDPDINVYDMRLVAHEDGYIYGIFCTERKDPAAPGDLSAAVAQAGIARTKDLLTWERLPDLVTPSPQQRNVVLHPTFVDGAYAFYTRPQDSFIDAGSGGGIGWGRSESINPAIVDQEIIVDARAYHTIKESKNGQGPAPIQTEHGWLHLAHGVRGTAAGLRYVLYAFMTALDEPYRITHAPGGYLLAPDGEERVGDVSNVVFSNGWIHDNHGRVLIYYASSDTRCHVAETRLDLLIDYVLHTPADGLRSAASVAQRIALIRKNAAL